MFVSYSSQCSTLDDYACNREIHVAATKEILWEMMKAFFNSAEGKKKFMKGYFVSAREKKLQDNATLMVVKKTLLIRKRCEEKKICGKVAESYITGYFNSTNITFGATTLSNAGNYDMFVAKLDSMGIATSFSELQTPNSEILIYPNPITSIATITFAVEQKNARVKVYDVVGKEIMNYKLSIINERSVTLI